MSYTALLQLKCTSVHFRLEQSSRDVNILNFFFVSDIFEQSTPDQPNPHPTAHVDMAILEVC